MNSENFKANIVSFVVKDIAAGDDNDSVVISGVNEVLVGAVLRRNSASSRGLEL